MVLNLDALRKSIDVLRRSLKVAEANKGTSDDDMRNTLRSGVIQNFEIAYEQCWKIMKRWLRENAGSAVDGVAQRELFRLSAEHRLILGVDNWMEYHEARNQSSHAYNENTADEVYTAARNFLPHAQKLLEQIEKHND